MPSMTLSAFNHLPTLEAGRLMLGVCPAPRWAEKVTAARPYNSHNELLYTAHRAWWSLTESEWRDVFSTYGPLEDRLELASEGRGPSGAQLTAERLEAPSEPNLSEIKPALFAAEHQYRQKFGYDFVVYLGGSSPNDLLLQCRQRLANEPGAELRTTAEEQARINRIALENVFP